jgi:spermidine synthase
MMMSNTNNYNEMLIHVPLCSHKNPENVLIITDDATGTATETARHDDMNFTTLAISKGNAMISDAADDSFDVIIFDTELSLDKAFLAHLNRVTKSDALIVSKIDGFMSNLDSTRATMQALGEYFRIVMPYSFDANQTDNQRATLMFASKFFHPTADVILHRTDMIDGLSYYNCDIHPATFVQPNYVRTALKGVALN